MNKEIVKINYLPIWGNNGTVYRCNFKMSRRLFDIWVDVLRAKAVQNSGDYYTDLWLNAPVSSKKDVYFFNLTQGKFLKEYLLRLYKDKQIIINPKRLLFDANVSIVVGK